MPLFSPNPQFFHDRGSPKARDVFLLTPLPSAEVAENVSPFQGDIQAIQPSADSYLYNEI